MQSFSEIARWLNDNQGVVSVLIFVITLFLGWVTGIFSSLMRRPKLRILLHQGPTFATTYLVEINDEQHDVHRTAIALYLNVANVGSAPTSIDDVSVGYHWHVRPFSRLWLQYRIGWFWLHNQTVSLKDFQTDIDENIKFFPFLFQRSTIAGTKPDTYLEIGKSANGVVYFEQNDSWGGCFPSPRSGRTRIKVAVLDVFGSKHTKSFWIPIVSLEQARVYNPSFGDTLSALRRGSAETASSCGDADAADSATNSPDRSGQETK